MLGEVVWKTMAGILNFRLMAAIQFHNILHGFRLGRGTGTASLEAKLLQKIMDMREKVLYNIFLDLHKAYDALNCDLCLDTLAACGAGPWDL